MSCDVDARSRRPRGRHVAGLLVTLVAVLTALLTQQVRCDGLRRGYFLYVVRVDRYRGSNRRQRLREDMAELMRELSA